MSLGHVVWRVLGGVKSARNFFRLVESTGIVVFVGPNGSGKSLAAVESALRTLDGVPWTCHELAHHHARPLREHVDSCSTCHRDVTGLVDVCPVGDLLVDLHCSGLRLVYSTVPLLDENGRPHERYRELASFTQLVTIEHADVLFDEVAGIADSSDSASMPTAVTNWLHQLRKRDNRLRVTTPAYARCAKPIRQVAQLVVDCRAFFPEKAVEGRLWRPRQGMMFRAFDAFRFEEYTASTGTRIKAAGTCAYWRADNRAQDSYLTLGAVTQLGHVTEGGMCSACGGGRSRPRCACPTGIDEVAPGDYVVSEKVSASGGRVRAAVIGAPLDLGPDLGHHHGNAPADAPVGDRDG